VTAHANRADVVEEDDAGNAAALGRLDEQRTDGDFPRRAARWRRPSDSGSNWRPKRFAPLGEAAFAEIRQAVDHDARRLARRCGNR